MPGSVASAGASSVRSGQYRKVGATSNIDESLFGNNDTKRPSNSKDIAVIGKDQLQAPGAGGRGGAKGKESKSDAIVIPASELNRLRDNATMLTKEEELAIKRRQEAVYAERMAKSQARKEKMMQMEEERKKNALLSDMEKESRSQKNSVLEKAKMMMDENLDDVKHMNQMMLYSKIVTIRDAQIQEKRNIQAEKEEQERQLDMMMEIERLKALKMYEEREKQRVEDQRRGASVIIEQIKDRQAQRMREEELRDQERAFILRQIEALKEEEVESQKQKKVAAARLMKEVNISNAAAMKIKEEKMLADKLEEQKIIEYQENREARERELEAEKARLAAEKEAETMRLRAMQEKAQDKAAEMDALRAKRASEAAERAARKKEQDEKDKFAALNADLQEARLQQQAEKERRLGEQAKFERDEFERIIEVQMQQEEAEKERQKEEKIMRMSHVGELRSQIAAREEKALQERRDFLEEGNVTRAQIGSERKKLEKIKARKMDELMKTGVPERYCAELARKKISI
eukprot:gnl/TRDRNA2_/TRDRNA2_179192_c0_seq1.p1 gnl/TRDRNA2_/TRDRNA2_179192_c0~~gnl/TRDRNA2_/TRDRNA2_179192_c0_seq1.p1  ORF type:complete len:519 (+),score=219.78 gnl/TRDRNA2_/TRDRNA2_179192_c0_seq1:105-1661(+)